MKWIRRRKNSRKIKAGAAAFLLCTGCLCFSALADGPYSNVWLDVVEIPSEARISVTVPLSYGFVVVGSVKGGNTGAVSEEKGNLMLSNVKVVVATPSDALPWEEAGELEFSIETIVESAIPAKNYSTDVREEYMGKDNPPREGLPVSLEPYILAVESGTIPGFGTFQHHWKPLTTEPQAIEEDFKRYRMELDGHPFSIEREMMIDGKKERVIGLDGVIELAAPPDVLTNGHTAAGTAIEPSDTYIPVDIKVGGVQNQYKQIEASLKVGEIRWNIIPGELSEKQIED